MTSTFGAWADTLAEELRAEMARQRMTMPQLASRSGIPLVSIERYVNGKRDIPTSKFEQICRALGVPISVMVSRVEDALARRGAADDGASSRRSG